MKDQIIREIDPMDENYIRCFTIFNRLFLRQEMDNAEEIESYYCPENSLIIVKKTK